MGENLKYKIVVDSCGEFTEEMKRDARFSHVALTLSIGDWRVTDDESFDRNKFIKEMAASKECPKSSCPSPQAYMDAFSGGYERIYGVTLSAELSGSYNSAELGKQLFLEKNPDRKVHIFNSRSAACGQTQIALKIRDCEEAGMEFDETVGTVEEFIRDMDTYFVLESLENLRKNGRLTGIKAFVASTLNIKPVMGATGEGTIIQLGQARGMQKALKKMTDIILETKKDTEKRILAITHCNCSERAEYVKQEFLKQAKFKDVLVLNTSGVSTLYANDGGVIIAL